MGNEASADDLVADVANLSIGDDKKDEKTQQVQDIPDAPVALKTLAHWILAECNNVVILSGAGVSVAAGIPDFRTPGTGLYDNLQKFQLPYAEAIFDVGFYRNNPQPFCTLAKEIWPGMIHSPTLTHSFISLLASKGKLLRVSSILSFSLSFGDGYFSLCGQNSTTSICLPLQCSGVHSKY